MKGLFLVLSCIGLLTSSSLADRIYEVCPNCNSICETRIQTTPYKVTNEIIYNEDYTIVVDIDNSKPDKFFKKIELVCPMCDTIKIKYIK